MRASFGGEGDPRRCGDEHETRVLVARVIHGIQSAADKGVVDRAEREQPLPEERARETERGEQQKEIVLSDAKLEVLPRGGLRPLLHGSHVLGAKGVLVRRAVEDATLVDPAP